ncbi:hypothetical protein N9K68_01090 [Luminiphilus sp.]|nr:hypothetical protein [Luminiphilus sp.]
MLTTQSFIIAVCAYGLAALVGLAMIRRLWFQRPASLASSVAMGLIGGLLLTPAYPSSEAASIAPALIVVIFNALFGDGIAAALQPALWLAAGGLAGALLGWWRARRRVSTESL